MKKTICLMAMSLIVAGTTFSQAFSDVSDKHWAKDAIDKMVDQGIISGYTDGTFQPSRNLSKIESLILLSKVAGVNKYTEASAQFDKKYETVLASYKTAYKKQVAYLLGVGVLTEDELPNLISADKLNSPITREEMAVLITKILGKEEEVKNKAFVILPFDDTDSISASAKPYVEYVYNESIMKGLTKNKFSPKEYVTRAQVAIILNSIVSKVDIVPEVEKEIVDDTKANVSLAQGKITSVDDILSTIEIDEENIYEYDENTVVYVNGTKGAISDIKVDMELTSAKINNGVISEIYIGKKQEESKAEEKTENAEYIVGKVVSATSKKVVLELENDEEITVYPVDEYQVIDAESAETMRLKKLDEDDKIIAVGEYDGKDYYASVIIRY